MTGLIHRIANYYRTKLAALKEQRFFRDRLSVILLVISLSLNALTLALLVAKVRPTEFPVPVRYSSLEGGFNSLGPWYQIYSLGVVGLGVTILNTILAIESFNRSRIASFFLMVGALVVALFCLIISNAFAVIVR